MTRLARTGKPARPANTTLEVCFGSGGGRHDTSPRGVDPTEGRRIRGILGIQLHYPIYNEPTETDGPLDFRTKFFAPKKHFWGNMYDTPYFNMIIIWLMSIFLMIALYYDGLRKLIKLFIRGIPFRYG